METSAALAGQQAEPGDEALLDRLRLGDPLAFEELWMRYYRQVYRVAYGIVGDAHEAEDLVQETFLALHGRPPRLQRGTPLRAWLCRVAIYRGYNTLRGARRAEERERRVDSEQEMPDPSMLVIRKEEQARVRAALARLPERQAKLLLLRHGGLSYGEIAAALDIAPGSIGTLLARAERAFLQVFEDGRARDGEGE